MRYTQFREIFGDPTHHLGHGNIDDCLRLGPAVLPGEKHREAHELQVEADEQRAPDAPPAPRRTHCWLGDI
jgi:hypothetical protein